jgi:repressor LexA
VKTYERNGDEVILHPANPTMEPMHFSTKDVTIYGRVVTVMRRL